MQYLLPTLQRRYEPVFIHPGFVFLFIFGQHLRISPHRFPARPGRRVSFTPYFRWLRICGRRAARGLSIRRCAPPLPALVDSISVRKSRECYASNCCVTQRADQEFTRRIAELARPAQRTIHSGECSPGRFYCHLRACSCSVRHPTNLPPCKNNRRRFDPSLDEARGSHSKRRSSRSNLREWAGNWDMLLRLR